MGITHEQNIDAWVRFPLTDRATGDPIPGIPANEVEVWYAKNGAFNFTPLSLVEGESANYIHIGDGVYAVLFIGSILDTLGPFTWIAKQSEIAEQDFQQHTEVDVVGRGDGYIDTINSIQTDVISLTTAVSDGFDGVAGALTDAQTSLALIISKVDALQASVDAIEGEIPSGITGSTT